MRKSMLPPGGTNLFQEIKKQCNEAEAAGIKIFRLTIGQPKGPALLLAREACSQAVLSGEESMHEYQDNGSPGIPGFAQDFVQLHIPRMLKEYEQSGQIKYLPIPGIKPTLGYVILACGTYLGIGRSVGVATMTAPGYPTPADQCRYLLADHYVLPTNPENNFRFSPFDIDPAVKLLMTNYPHNPSGQVATTDFWRKLCHYCVDNGIRLFNDGAYAILSHSKECAMLSEVAIDFPDLSWAEAFSASKVIANGTGWRIGAMVGSADFINDITTIKGNSDSGFFAPAAVGTLRCMKEDMSSIIENRNMYGVRISLISQLLTERGMKLAVSPGAGFFTLWLTPKEAFGQKIKDAAEFNELMIRNTGMGLGIPGVPFGRYIRYAVTNPIEQREWQDAIIAVFDKAKVKY